MKRDKCILTVLLLVMYTGVLSAQYKERIGIKTNTLSDITLSPNIDMNFYPGENVLFSIGGSYGWWGFDRDTKNAFQKWQVNAEVQYYTRKDSLFTGHHFGLGVQSGQFDVRWNNKDPQRGHFATAGLIYGYTWKLSDHFYLDAGLGVGYIYTFYHKYVYSPEYGHYCCINHPTKHGIGLTNLNLSLIYRFKKGGKR
ncbi:DUF3575 domain-containing protein [Parabacteroides sp. OttesenSCG-928-G07]|nr:DUF3575 domain-containing protein [Parabacteroides sp. OttesenSCG-928-G07]